MENSVIVEKVINRIKNAKTVGSNQYCIKVDKELSLEFNTEFKSSLYSYTVKINSVEIAKFINNVQENEINFYQVIDRALSDKREEEKQAALKLL